MRDGQGGLSEWHGAISRGQAASDDSELVSSPYLDAVAFPWQRMGYSEALTDTRSWCTDQLVASSNYLDDAHPSCLILDPAQALVWFSSAALVAVGTPMIQVSGCCD